jgi:hypothetical protein
VVTDVDPLLRWSLAVIRRGGAAPLSCRARRRLGARTARAGRLGRWQSTCCPPARRRARCLLAALSFVAPAGSRRAVVAASASRRWQLLITLALAQHRPRT